MAVLVQPRLLNLTLIAILGAFMPILQEAEALLPRLTPGEKAQVLQWVARDLGASFPGIGSDPAVCGGEACISRSRIPVWVLVQAKIQGLSEADLLRSFLTLRAEDLVNAWAYERAHREEIARDIQENEAA